MKYQPLLLFAAALIVLAVALVLSCSVYWESKQPVFQEGPKLFAALQAFCRDESENGLLPPEVSLQELIRGGYLTTNDVQAFEGMEVTFSTHYADAVPQLILARAVAPNGQLTCLLTDGSVQQLSPPKYRAYLHRHPKPAAANQIGPRN